MHSVKFIIEVYSVPVSELEILIGIRKGPQPKYLDRIKGNTEMQVYNLNSLS
jgi:hypothetical protein